MGFTLSLRKKTNDKTLFLFGACCKWGRHLYTIAAPSCCIPLSYYHLSATLQIMIVTVASLQDNRAVFRILITLLRFSFDSPSYFIIYQVFYFFARFSTSIIGSLQCIQLLRKAAEVFPCCSMYLCSSFSVTVKHCIMPNQNKL